jgi:hypothetical protein
MSDDLRSTLESAVEEHTPVEPPSPAPVETPVAPAPSVEPTSEENRPDLPLEGSEKIAPTKTIEGEPKPITEVVGEKPVDKAATDPRIDRAPQSWKGESKKVWAELPLNVRQEVIRRERETTKVMQEAAQARQQVGHIQEVFAPHMDRINSVYGGDAMTAVTNLLAVERQLFTGTPGAKAQLIANMIQQFGIDIRTLDNLLVGQPAPQEVQQQTAIERLLEQKLQPLQQFIQSQQQREQQQVRQVEEQAVHTVESMALDPKFPYFDEVRQDMADLIETASRRGIYLSLEQAYTKAVRMNDDTYQATSVRTESQAATSAAMQAHQAAQKAKGASVSVSGNPSGGSPGVVSDPSNLRGTIESLWSGSGERV